MRGNSQPLPDFSPRERGKGKGKGKIDLLLKAAYEKPPTHNWINLLGHLPTIFASYSSVQGSDNSSNRHSSNCHSYSCVRSVFPLPGKKHKYNTPHHTTTRTKLLTFFFFSFLACPTPFPVPVSRCPSCPCCPFFLTCPRRALDPSLSPGRNPCFCKLPYSFHRVHLWNRCSNPLCMEAQGQAHSCPREPPINE